MRRDRVVLILAALLAFSGCHSRQNPPASDNSPISQAVQSPAPQPQKIDDRPKLVCFGDSLTAGYGTDPGQSYPDYLQQDLDAAGYHYHVMNEGVSGATTKDGVSRLPRIAALKPAVVVVEFGGNDGLRGLPIEMTEANLDLIVEALKATGAKVALAGITLPPDYGPDYVNRFTAIYAAVAKRHNVPLFPFLLQGVFGVDGMMQRDNTHATGEGNRIVAKNVMHLVEPLLKK